ncbi:MAG: L-2-amino-thiazoline-4-carboxylic acid hydrolase [Sporomusaceae bacterium]|nr:L-2-amino-thiazoline-4-carboxylic acid hydrolase [Sporomusaceae bacterium]
MIINEAKLHDDELVNVRRSATEHRATWTGLTYVKAREAGEAAAAEKFIRQAIVETGLTQGAELKAACSDPENLSCFGDVFLGPDVAKTFELEYRHKTQELLEMDFHYCPLLKAWQKLGLDDETCEKLCDMAMDGDRYIAKAMGYGFELGDTIAKGCKTCHITYFKKEK